MCFYHLDISLQKAEITPLLSKEVVKNDIWYGIIIITNYSANQYMYKALEMIMRDNYINQLTDLSLPEILEEINCNKLYSRGL